LAASLDGSKAWLWTTTTAARNRPDPQVIEIISGIQLRHAYTLDDGDQVCVEISP
jgi:CTP-dependent riboflavin kinase